VTSNTANNIGIYCLHTHIASLLRIGVLGDILLLIHYSTVTVQV